MLLFALTVLVSSVLLFMVQPIIAKQIVPWFGGSAGVWTTCLTFFQLVLLAGYAYSDLVQRFSAKSRYGESWGCWQSRLVCRISCCPPQGR
jgi:hypothetical protein